MSTDKKSTLTDKKRVSSRVRRGASAPKVKGASVLGGAIVKMRLRAYYPDRLDHSIPKIIEAVKPTGAVVRGPIPLPNRTRRWTLLKSPHVDKDAREQLQQTEHTRLLILHVSSEDTMSAIQKLELPPEVYPEVDVESNHSE